MQISQEKTIKVKQLDPDLREQLNQCKESPTELGLFELGDLFYQRGHEDITMMYYHKIVKEAPYFTPAKAELANLYFKNGSLAEARELYLELVEEDNTTEQDLIMHNLGIIAWREDDKEQAVKWWKRVIAEFPGFGDSYDALITEAIDKGDLQRVKSLRKRKKKALKVSLKQKEREILDMVVTELEKSNTSWLKRIRDLFGI